MSIVSFSHSFTSFRADPMQTELAIDACKQSIFSHKGLTNADFVWSITRTGKITTVSAHQIGDSVFNYAGTYSEAAWRNKLAQHGFLNVLQNGV